MEVDMIAVGRELLAQFRTNGFEAYLVGGCVRDHLLDRPIHDVDICTSARPEQVQSLFKHTIPTGIKHGTVTVIWHEIPVEVTTYRTEQGYQNFRHPNDIQFVGSLQEDLERRDFTINAMAMNEAGEVIDPFNGQQDLRNKRIHSVGNPADRFQEDALRMLRAIRFSAELHFTIDPHLLEELRRYAALIEHLSRERVAAEFEKIMAADHVQQGLYYLVSGHLTHVFPFHFIADAFTSAMEMPLSQLQPLERWVLLLHVAADREQRSDANKNAKKHLTFLKKLCVRKKQSQEIRQLLHHLERYQGRMDAQQFTHLELFHLGRKQAGSVLRVNQIKMEGKIVPAELRKLLHIFQTFPIERIDELQISGKDVIDLIQKEPGPWVRATLRRTAEAVLKGNVVNQRNALLRYIAESEM